MEKIPIQTEIIADNIKTKDKSATAKKLILNTGILQLIGIVSSLLIFLIFKSVKYIAQSLENFSLEVFFYNIYNPFYINYNILF